jgi:cell division protein FtsB
MSKQISAVEWYENRIFILQIQLEKKEISLGEYSATRVELFKQAKEMEKEQIIDAYLSKRNRTDLLGALKIMDKAEQYYKQTYESNVRI